MPTNTIITIIIATVLAVAITIYFWTTKTHLRHKVENTKLEADTMIAQAKSEAQNMKYKVMQEIDSQHSILASRRDKISDRNDRLQEQQIELERQSVRLSQQDKQLERLEISLDKREDDINDRIKTVEQKEKLAQKELARISSYTPDEAKKLVLEKAKDDIKSDLGKWLKAETEKAEEQAAQKATQLIAEVLPKYSRDVASERTASRVSIPNDELKGKLIGREGRNIRAFEAATGVDLLIDDTPNTVTVSCFDPIRREVAKRALTKLVADGRIQPTAIEEQVAASRNGMEDEFFVTAKEVMYDLGIESIPREIRRLIGVLKYRTSYGQSALKHSIEVAHLSGLLAKELGQNVTLAKRAGLLHDIGKAMDFNQEGTHVELGARLCEQYNEDAIVINGIETHHGDKPPIGIIPILVTAADALSASRPGARRQSLEEYVSRMRNLEAIAKDYPEVSQAFAIRAGREIRIMVKPDTTDDGRCAIIAKEVKEKIQDTLTYPGNITVNVIREHRSTEIAQ